MTLENISLCDNGNIELCDNGNIAFCPVPAPSSCPCTSWPGVYPWDSEDEPCGGLLDEYIVKNNLTSPVDGASVFFYETLLGFEYRFTSSHRVYATATECFWETDTEIVLEYREKIAGEWSSWQEISKQYEIRVFHDTSVFYSVDHTWMVQLWKDGEGPSGRLDVGKDVGLSPTGVYNKQNVAGTGFWGVVVTEPAP